MINISSPIQFELIKEWNVLPYSITGSLLFNHVCQSCSPWFVFINKFRFRIWKMKISVSVNLLNWNPFKELKSTNYFISIFYFTDSVLIILLFDLLHVSMLYKQQLRCSICMLALFKQFSIQGRRSFTGQFRVECHVILHDAIAKCWHWDCCTRVITSSHISECSITKWLRSGRHLEIWSTVDYAVAWSRTWIAVDPVGFIFRVGTIGLFIDRRCFGFSKFFMIFSIFFFLEWLAP